MNAILSSIRAPCRSSTAGQRVFPSRYLRTRPGEDELHIGNQLSRPSERVKAKHQEWSKIVSKFPKSDWHTAHPTGLVDWRAGGYEYDGLKRINKRSFGANVLVEIRDVRLPASSHHPSFTRLAKHRTHLIAYTHADLIDAATRDKVEAWTNHIWPESRSIFVDTRDGSRNDTLPNFNSMLDGLLHFIEASSQNYALTCGCANVGKSSVLMTLLRLARQRGMIPKNTIKTRVSDKKSNVRKGRVPGVEDVAGKTREVTDYLLREKPRAFFMDVPGITPPSYFFNERPEAWFGFGATNLLPMNKALEENVKLHKQHCEYVLHCANRDRIFHYVDKLNLDGPTTDIDECLSKFANSYKDKYDEDRLTLKRCENFLKLFNTGNLGPLILDDMSDFDWQPFKTDEKEGHVRRERSRQKVKAIKQRKHDDDDDDEDLLELEDDDEDFGRITSRISSSKSQHKIDRQTSKDDDDWYDGYDDFINGPGKGVRKQRR